MWIYSKCVYIGIYVQSSISTHFPDLTDLPALFPKIMHLKSWGTGSQLKNGRKIEMHMCHEMNL